MQHFQIQRWIPRAYFDWTNRLELVSIERLETSPDVFGEILELTRQNRTFSKYDFISWGRCIGMYFTSRVQIPFLDYVIRRLMCHDQLTLTSCMKKNHSTSMHPETDKHMQTQVKHLDPIAVGMSTVLRYAAYNPAYL